MEDEGWIYKKVFHPNERFDLKALKSEIQSALDFKPINFRERDMFALQKDFTEWVLEGKKNTTIRYKSHHIDIPSRLDLKVIITNRFERDYRNRRESHSFRINDFGIKHFRNITEIDASNDGFEDLDEARRVLHEIYPDIRDLSVVSIYGIEALQTKGALSGPAGSASKAS